MKQIFVKAILAVHGMSCSGCESRIERLLGRMSGVQKVKASFSSNSVAVEYDPAAVDVPQMAATLDKAGYTLENGGAVAASGKIENDARKGKVKRINQVIGLAIIVFAAYFIIEKTAGLNILPEVNASMGYGMLFLVGLLTSLHCVAMCGGINMSQCVSSATPGDKSAARFWPSVQYNTGRVISYTIIGGIVGAIGSVISFSGWARGIVAVLSGVFMVLMGLSMLGIFPWLNKITPRMPRFLRSKAGRAGQSRGPFIVGLLNGLMPCGPLQAMQIYALGTGSFITGALSMFLFSLGTVPLMFGLGAISALLSSRFTSRMMKVSAALVLLLGFVMVGRGLALSGINPIQSAGQPQTAAGRKVSAASGNPIVDGVQQVTSKLASGSYPEITVQAGIPVRWNLKADAKDLNGCNKTLVIPAYDKEVALKAGDNIIEFTPEKEGTIPYSCWMGMITSKIYVVAAPAATATADAAAVGGAGTAGLTGLTGGGCCASAALAPEFANGKIPVDDIEVAKVVNGVQEVTITVNDQGYSPAVAVVQKGIKTKVKFVAEKLNSCNSTVVFPDYNGSLSLADGQLETPALTPEKDFTFECGMGMLHGYVKVVTDINTVDMAKIKNEISKYKPAATGGGCCRHKWLNHGGNYAGKAI